MKRKILSILLCAVLLLSIMPFASAASYGTAPSLTLTSTTGSSTNLSSLTGTPVVLVFGKMGENFCQNTNSTLSALNGLVSETIYNGVSVYFLDIISSNTVAAINTNMTAYSNVNACVTSGSYNSQLWTFLRACGDSSTAVTLPGVFFIDKNGEIVSYHTGLMTVSEIESVFSGAFGLGGTDPCTGGHTWDSGKVTTEATGTTDGVKTYTCTVCGATKTEVIPATGVTQATDTYTGSSSNGSAYSYEWEVLKLTNKARMGNGLLPLSTFSTLQTAAGTRANELITLYSHTRPDDSSCFTVLADLNLSYSHAAENIAAGYLTPSAVVTGWLNSSGHYANIMTASLTHMGVGYDTGGSYGKNWVQLFLNNNCNFSSISLANASGVTVQAGESIDDLGVVVMLTCSKHGTSYMPLIEEMCSGYDSSKAGSQTVTVKYGSLSTTFTVTVEATDPCASGHTWNSGVVTTAATCIEAGVRTYTCTVCGETKTETISATGHTWNSGVVTTAATCTKAGVKTYTCTGCGETKTETISATGHTWNSGVVTTAATSTTTGVKTYTCTSCGETKTEVIPATGTTSCTNGHTWNSGVVTTAATCTKAGVRTYTCTVCGETKTEAISATGHTWNSGVVTTAATSTTTGVKTYTCTSCGETKNEVIPATGTTSCTNGHTWNSGVVTTAATCTKAGVKTYTCTVCGETKAEAISATGHTWNSGVVTTAATCTKTGVVTYTCTACGETKKVTISATGHTWNSGKVVTAATCTEAGVMKYTCTVCGETKTAAIPATGHTVVIDKAVAATTSHTGLTQGSHCSVCGEVIVAQTVTPIVQTGETENGSEAGSPDVIPSNGTAYASTQLVSIDGVSIELQAYALKDENGYETNYVKLRDVAFVLSGSAAQFNVGWDGNVNIITGSTYTSNGSEMFTPFSGNRSYTAATAVTNVDGAAASLTAFVLNDDNGGGYTYYQLRDLGKVLGFNVGWSATRGVFIETNKAYTDAD